MEQRSGRTGGRGKGGCGDERLNAGITNDAMFYAYRITINAGGKKIFRLTVE